MSRRLAVPPFLFLLAAMQITLCGSSWAQSLELMPYKDKLFAYPAILSSTDGGAAIVVDYQEFRDINQRDTVPERRVKPAYVDLGVRRSQQDLSLDGIRHVAVGRTEGARIITIYLHGQGGDRRQGTNDFTFGGNFNRIKNLMARNGGLYLTVDLPDFGADGASAVSRLIAHYARWSPDAPVFVACGSMGGMVCWRLAADDRVAQRLGGLILLGVDRDQRFLASPAFRRRVPVLFAHGSRDSVFPVDRQQVFYDAIRRHAQGYPVRFVRFETGTHGTPIRMVDWRGTLNWMLSIR